MSTQYYIKDRKKYKCNSNWISEWWIWLFVVILFVLITYYVTSPLLIGKKFVDDVHTFYEDHGLDLKIKNLSEKMSTCFCLMACHARNGWVLQWLPFSQSALPYLFFCYTSSQWPLLLDTELVIGTCFFILNLRTKSKLPTCKKDFALVKGKSFIHSIHVLLLVCSLSRLID